MKIRFGFNFGSCCRQRSFAFGPVVDLCPTGLSSPSVLHTWATAHWRAGRAPNPRIIITHRLPGGWVTFPAIRTHLPSANCGQDPYSVTVRKNKDTKLIFNICWYKSYVLNKKIKSNAPFGTFINYKSLKTLCACQFNPSKGYKITSIAHDQWNIRLKCKSYAVAYPSFHVAFHIVSIIGWLTNSPYIYNVYLECENLYDHDVQNFPYPLGKIMIVSSSSRGNWQCKSILRSLQICSFN